MTAQPTRKMEKCSASTKDAKSGSELLVTVKSFGYKQGPPPLANVLFDVRFLKNPYWVEELRPLTGLDKPVQEYVLQQPLAQDFLESVVNLLGKILPEMAEMKVNEFVVALGCTGGQHRSTTLVEALVSRLNERFPHYRIVAEHKELSSRAVECGANNEGNEEQ